MPRPPVPSAVDPQIDRCSWPVEREPRPGLRIMVGHPSHCQRPCFGDRGAEFGFGRTQDCNAERSIVRLHIYDVGVFSATQVLNKVLRPLSLGAFHCGVEVYGWEWSYRDTAPLHKDRAVFSCLPATCKGHTYVESVDMGFTHRSAKEVTNILQLLHATWPGENYDVLNRNCCHFCDEYCKFLRVGAIPAHLLNLASMGQALAGSLAYLDERRQALALKALEMPEKLDPRTMFEMGCCRQVTKARPCDQVDDAEDHVADVIEQFPTRSAFGRAQDEVA